MDAYRCHFIFVCSFPQRYTFIDTLLHRFNSKFATHRIRQIHLKEQIALSKANQTNRSLDIIQEIEYNKHRAKKKEKGSLTV